MALRNVHASTAVAYFWLGVASFIAAVFILYAILFRMAAEETSLIKISTATHSVTRRAITLDTSYKNAFMHIFLRETSDFNPLDFKDPIHNITNSFKDFNFTLYLMLDQPKNNNQKRNYPTKHENNIEAFHKVLSSRPINRYSDLETPNFKVVETSVDTYCRDASLSKILLRTNSHLRPFIIRTISIWEDGGVAFDPYILLNDNVSLHNNHTISKRGLYETFSTMDSKNDFKIHDENNENITKNKSVGSNVDENQNFEALVTLNNFTKINESSVSDTTKRHKLRQSVFLRKVLRLLNYFSRDGLPDDMARDTDKPDSSDEIANEEFNLEDLKKYENLRQAIHAKRYDKDHFHIGLKEIPELVQNIVSNNQVRLFIESRGLFLGTKAQCHPFLGVVFTTISTKEESVEEFLKKGMSYYCQDNAVCPDIRIV